MHLTKSTNEYRSVSWIRNAVKTARLALYDMTYNAFSAVMDSWVIERKFIRKGELGLKSVECMFMKMEIPWNIRKQLSGDREETVLKCWCMATNGYAVMNDSVISAIRKATELFPDDFMEKAGLLGELEQLVSEIRNTNDIRAVEKKLFEDNISELTEMMKYLNGTEE